MTRERVRPTRETTQLRLFEAAAGVFAEHGVGAATVEQIVSAAGFSRGAFYSNFDSKEDLLLAMLNHHVRRSIEHNLKVLAEHPMNFVEAMADDSGREDDPLHATPLLQMELIMHVARTPEHRPLLAHRLSSMRTLIGEIVVATMRAAGVDRELDVESTGALLLAIEDGFRLHRLIDPASTPPDAFPKAVIELRELMFQTVPSGGEPRA